ncbi:MAG: hypothetical protein HYW49_00945 [Deltaproteobacteria bacterium]|nr:hypothetical protein [Deltaproteobacteria bacterium]
MRKLILTILGMMLLAPAAGAAAYVCTGNAVSQHGAKGKAIAGFRFSASAINGRIVISRLTGTVRTVDPAVGGDLNNLNDVYIGYFKIRTLVNNPDFNPRKYTGYVQFKNVDAVRTAGLESGMWGTLVLDLRSGRQPFSGAYIFQAGDHMGGTIHLRCAQ